MSVYEYTDHGGVKLTITDYVGRLACVAVGDDVCADVKSEDERRAAAQALAGPGWRVVPATSGQHVEKHGDAWRADGTCAYAGCDVYRTETPQQATVADPPPVDPPPVDPASVRVGQWVEVSWRTSRLRQVVEGEVYKVTDGDPKHPFNLRGYGSPEITSTTVVRPVDPPEPEPDPEQVDALYRVYMDAEESVIDPDDGSYNGREHVRELVRRGVTAPVEAQ